MNYITTTELRTKTTELVDALRAGDEVGILHRSKVLGKITPTVLNSRKTKTVTDPAKLISGLKHLIGDAGKYSREERDSLYRKHVESKYGKYLSRR